MSSLQTKVNVSALKAFLDVWTQAKLYFMREISSDSNSYRLDARISSNRDDTKFSRSDDESKNKMFQIR